MHLTPDGPADGGLHASENTHNLKRLLRFFISMCLALGCDLLF
jgi:hypothetical protein